MPRPSNCSSNGSVRQCQPTISVVVPIASLTALGSASGDVIGAVAAIVDYLEGHQSISPSAEAPAVDSAALVGYYADTKTSDSLGWWSGRGINGTQLNGTVDPAMLAQVLLGQHPHTGEQLVAATGSAGRATSRRSSNGLLTVADVADELGVSTQRIGQLVAAGTRRAAAHDGRRRRVLSMLT